MMTSTKKTLARTLSGLALAVATVGCGLVLTASARAAAVAALAPVQPLLTAAGKIDLAPATAASGPTPATQVAQVGVTETKETKVEITPPEPLTVAPPMSAAQQEDGAPSLEQIKAASSPATKMMRYTLYGLEDREFVVPSSKALLDDLIKGRDPNGEPVDLFRLTVEGLSPEDTRRIAESRNVRNADPAPFEGPWAGSATWMIELGGRRSRDSRVPPTEARAQAALPAARATIDVALARPEKVRFRQVYATYAPGIYNGTSRGHAYIGFCGEIDTGGVTSAWRKFFVSETPTSANGVTQKIFYGDVAVELCGGRREGDYTFDFETLRLLSAKYAGR